MRHAVILAGGSGTRLWPASRRATPKQYLSLGPTGQTLLAAAACRALAVAGPRLLVVTAESQASTAAAAVAPYCPEAVIVGEPIGRNTAPALGLAAVHLLHRDPDAVMVCLPADQHVDDEPGLMSALELALAAVEQHNVIGTVGIVPTRVETGFGYLHLGLPVTPEQPLLRKVAAFVEKPNAATAQAYVDGGEHLWNAGIVLIRAQRLRDELARTQPALSAALDTIAAAMHAGPAAAAAAVANSYNTMPSISFDHAVMEHANDVVTVAAEVGWDDVGSWEALAARSVANFLELDGSGNVVFDDVDGIVALVGVSDLVVVRAGNAVLVIPRARAQEVRAVVAELAARGLDRFL